MMSFHFNPSSYGSHTMTITEPQPPATQVPQGAKKSDVIRLRLNSSSSAGVLPKLKLRSKKFKLTPGQEVELLLEKMEEAVKALSDNQEHQKKVLDAIRQWGVRFFSNYDIDSWDDRQRLAAAHAIVIFRRINIKPIILCAPNEAEKLKWLRFYNKLQDVMASALPPSAVASAGSVEAFIECHEKKLEAVILYEQYKKLRPEISNMMKNLKERFVELETLLYADVSKIMQEMQAEFDELKTLLLELNDHQKNTTDQLHAKIDKLNESVAGIFNDLKLQLHDIQKLEENIANQDNVLMANLDWLQNTIDKVKV